MGATPDEKTEQKQLAKALNKVDINYDEHSKPGMLFDAIKALAAKLSQDDLLNTTYKKQTKAPKDFYQTNAKRGKGTRLRVPHVELSLFGFLAHRLLASKRAQKVLQKEQTSPYAVRLYSYQKIARQHDDVEKALIEMLFEVDKLPNSKIEQGYLEKLAKKKGFKAELEKAFRQRLTKIQDPSQQKALYEKMLDKKQPLGLIMTTKRQKSAFWKETTATENRLREEMETMTVRKVQEQEQVEEKNSTELRELKGPK